MPIIAPITSDEDRDAWATIRGYVYQVDMSIRRWLSLSPDEAIELECGEDIDLIPAVLEAQVDHRRRLLEQVKHNDQTLTLRSLNARTFLAHAFEHSQRNPDLTLSFRLTTNARVGIERDTPMLNLTPGVQVWEAIRLGTYPPALENEALGAIRALLKKKRPPVGLPIPTWREFQRFLRASDSDQLREFVRACEFATLSPGSQSIRNVLLIELQDLGYACSETEADQLYQRLFLAVFKKLSTRELKRLTKNDLEYELAAPTLSDGDRARLAVLEELHKHLETRVTDLELGLSRMVGAIADTNTKVDSLVEAAGITALVTAGDVVVAAAQYEPPLAGHASFRRTTVDGIIANSGFPSLVVLYGPSASGKTQLALLVARRLGRALWLRLAGQPPSISGPSLELAIDRLAGYVLGSPKPSLEQLCRAALMNADVVVLDDIPEFREGDTLGGRLLPLVRVALAMGKSVVTTTVSASRSPWDQVTKARCHVLAAPALSVEEVGEVLLSWGASNEILSQGMLELLAGLSAGHPVLVQALGDYLQQRTWRVSSDVLKDLLHGAYTEAIRSEVVRSLLREVTDAVSRDLLYRLTLLQGVFEFREVQVLAEVPPPVTLRRERFAPLVGPWIQDEGRGRYSLSPLVKALGADDLPVAVSRGCHEALALDIVGRNTIGEGEFDRAFLHFIHADRVNSAALLLIRAWRSFDTGGWGTRTPRFTKYWVDVPLPGDMDAAIGLMLRAEQAHAAIRAGEDPQFLVNDIRLKLTSAAPPPSWVSYPACVRMAMAFEGHNIELSSFFAAQAVLLWPRFKSEYPGILSAVQSGHALDTDEVEAAPSVVGMESFEPGVLVWAYVTSLESNADYDAWLSALELIPRNTMAETANSRLGRQGFDIAAHGLVMREKARPREDQRWSEVLPRLERMERLAHSARSMSMIGAATSARMLYLAQGIGALEMAAQLCRLTLERFAGDPQVGLLVRAMMGSLFYDAKLFEKAATQLEEASKLCQENHPYEEVNVLLRLAQLKSQGDIDAAMRYAARATVIAGRAQTLPGDSPGAIVVAPSHLLSARAWGERGAVLFKAEKLKDACSAWLCACDHLVKGRNEADVHWRVLAVALTNVLLGVVSMLGKPPGNDPDDLQLVSPGNLLGGNLQLDQYFRPSKLAILAVCCADLADHVGESELALEWARKAMKWQIAGGLWFAAVVPMRRVVNHDLLACNFQEALAVGLDLSASLVAMATPTTIDIEVPCERPLDTARQSSSQSMPAVLAHTFQTVLLPAAFLVARSQLTNSAHASTLVESLRAVCRALVDPNEPNNVWDQAAGVIDSAFVRQENATPLTERARELAGHGSQAQSVLAVIAYLAASMREGVVVEQKAQIHARILEFVRRSFASDPRLHDKVVTPFFMEFWQKNFAEARFRFRAPSLVEQRLRQLTTEGDMEQLRALFHTVFIALEITPRPEISAWLDTG